MKKIRPSRPRIAIKLESTACPFTKSELVRFAEAVLRGIHKSGYGVSVYVVNSSRMKRLHRDFFGDASDTDCISFSQYEGRAIRGERTLGEVFVSWSQVRRQAPKFSHTPQEELLYCIVHGILHLIGYEDRTLTQRKKMFHVQDRIFKKYAYTKI
ncbi:MAG: rRNA maturation RNase YbeY [Candidatus Omnitrophica bacterium]|nr:rRNA maturation RNase YbeY [Candidatus Omnitrophota bacterium]